jgi:hypothetical protein
LLPPEQFELVLAGSVSKAATLPGIPALDVVVAEVSDSIPPDADLARDPVKREPIE